MQGWHDMPFGAAVRPDGRIRFRLWAPAARHVSVSLEHPDVPRLLPMDALDDGWFELVTDRARVGSRYRYAIENAILVPDPAARFQPGDVHGASQVVDAGAYRWSDHDWRGRPWEDVVLYEIHVGTFTPAGTFRALVPRLAALADLGVTAIELMPVADFPGARNWGYDGVLPFAPDASYGRPEDLKALVDAAHVLGLMVFLDVVYNHFGPEGNALGRYAPAFFTDRHRTPWGDAINFDGPDSRVVRDFFLHNALYWLEEYHMDGLRLDAVHAIHDDSRPPILTELAHRVRQHAGARHTHLVLENDANAAHLLRAPGASYDAQWNDDWHHALHVLATGETDGYYEDYAHDTLHDVGRCLAEGLAYQGEPSPYRGGQGRGEPSAALPATAFVAFLQNHDQIGNRGFGERIGALAPERTVRALTELLLLAPSVPLLFMGQEWGSRRPFPFFCDFGPELAAAVTEGRRREFARFPAFQDPAVRARIPDPNAEETFRSATLDETEATRPHHREMLALHRELLALRAREIAPRLRGLTGNDSRYHVHPGPLLAVRWRLADDSTLSLLFNPGPATVREAPRPAGRVLYASDGASADLLPPWSVAWFLEP